jgi:NADH-quinone oxidoreductase subunit A
MELVFVVLIFGLLGVVLISMNALLGPKKTNPAKEQPFECGSPYLQSEIKPFPIKFALVAFVFLLFDVEVVFIFREMKGPALVLMLSYGTVLVAGFAYAWKKGAFVWD